MRKLYETKEVLFAVLWILIYCLVLTPIKGKLGFDSIVMLSVLAAFAICIFLFVKLNHLEEKYGLDRFPKDAKKYLYFIPMWILVTGNLWGGITLNYTAASLIIAVLSMAIVGFVEEMLFRGFLFKAMLKDGKPVVAIIVSAVTFGIGHIVNILTGQASVETFLQMLFAVGLGFIFTIVCYVSGSIIPCIIAHSLIDVFSLFAVDNKIIDMIYIFATIIISAAYCIFLVLRYRRGK